MCMYTCMPSSLFCPGHSAASALGAHDMAKFPGCERPEFQDVWRGSPGGQKGGSYKPRKGARAPKGVFFLDIKDIKDLWNIMEKWLKQNAVKHFLNMIEHMWNISYVIYIYTHTYICVETTNKCRWLDGYFAARRASATRVKPSHRSMAVGEPVLGANWKKNWTTKTGHDSVLFSIIFYDVLLNFTWTRIRWKPNSNVDSRLLFPLR